MDQDTRDLGPTEGTWPWRTIMLVVMGVLGAVTLVAIVVTLGQANRERDRALKLQSHSYDVMILARTLSGTVARSEASLGRYVISGDRQLGQLYYDQWLLAGNQIARLDQLTFDSLEQQRRIDRLREAYRARGEELSMTALSTSYGRNSQALARYYAARKAPTLTVFDRELDRLIARERDLLDTRTAAAMESIAFSSTAARGLSVFGGLIVLGAIVLGWITVRTLGERASARADAEAAQAQAEELTAAVAAATDELRVQEAKLRQIQKMEAVGQLTGGIAHDFNNMLAVVLGGLELARRNAGQDASSTLRHIDSATEGANRAAALTRRLLAFSREDAPAPEQIVPAALVSGMSDLLDRTLGDAVTLVAQDNGQGWRVQADRTQLENAVLNLAVNARDAMNARGVLTIVTGTTTLHAGAIGQCPAGDYVTLAVADTGCGMTPEIAERVFEPFFTTKPAGKGTGLGLSQVFALVRHLGGEIGIASQPGFGTTVTLYLPRDRAQPVAVVPTAAVAQPVAAGPLSVLVVEDDPRVLAATMGALEELGHHAIACDDPVAAPALLQTHRDIDLIISDVLMPRQTGPEMIAELGPRHPHIAVLFVTGYAGDGGEAGDFGHHVVLRKPFTLSGIEAAIAAAMAVVRPAAPHRIAAE